MYLLEYNHPAMSLHPELSEHGILSFYSVFCSALRVQQLGLFALLCITKTTKMPDDACMRWGMKRRRPPVTALRCMFASCCCSHPHLCELGRSFVGSYTQETDFRPA